MMLGVRTYTGSRGLHVMARSAGQVVSVTGTRTNGSTSREKALRKKMKRKRQIGKLYMLAKSLVKTSLGRGFRAMHDFHEKRC